jgi:hypothetical protein
MLSHLETQGKNTVEEPSGLGQQAYSRLKEWKFEIQMDMRKVVGGRQAYEAFRCQTVHAMRLSLSN